MRSCGHQKVRFFKCVVRVVEVDGIRLRDRWESVLAKIDHVKKQSGLAFNAGLYIRLDYVVKLNFAQTFITIR